jgi:hypothetical protein
MPLFAFGMQNSLVKFFSHAKPGGIFFFFCSFIAVLLSIPLLLIGLYFLMIFQYIYLRKPNSEGLLG